MIGDKLRKKGFTLVELLMVVFIFIIIVTGVVSVFIRGISLQQRIMAEQKMFSEVSFALEYMGRTLRMARKDINGTCIAGKNHNYSLLGEGRTIRFLNHDGLCHEFSLTGTSISERISTDASFANLPATFIVFTSSSAVVSGLIFNNAGSAWSSPAANQSKIAIAMVVNAVGGTSMRIQTLISQRKLNVVF